MTKDHVTEWWEPDKAPQYVRAIFASGGVTRTPEWDEWLKRVMTDYEPNNTTEPAYPAATTRASFYGYNRHSAEDAAWARNELGLFTYKPGWNFRITGAAPERSHLYGPYLELTAEVEDTYNPGKRVVVGASHSLATMGVHHRDPNMFGRMLGQYVQSAEIHESREWLKRGGVIFDDPHK